MENKSVFMKYVLLLSSIWVLHKNDNIHIYIYAQPTEINSVKSSFKWMTSIMKEYGYLVKYIKQWKNNRMHFIIKLDKKRTSNIFLFKNIYKK